jgi:hypothetical protein
VTTTHDHPSLTNRTATGAHAGAVAGRLSDRIHAADDDHSRAQGWEITQTPGRLGLTGRSYRDPRFDARRQDPQDTPASRDERHG